MEFKEVWTPSVLLDNLHDGVYFVDRDRRILYWNRAAERITGFSADEVVGTACADNILTHVNEEGENLCLGRCPLAATMEDGEFREENVFLHHKRGHRVPVSVRAAALQDEEGNITGAVEVFTDISDREANLLRIRELEEMAMLDPLTGLANRRYMEGELEGRIGESERSAVPFGVIFMDIDHFKAINDQYGHDVGDEVLKTVSSTLAKCTRSFDVVGRWGGEEFVVLLRNVDRESLGNIADRYRNLVAQSLTHTAGATIRATVSLGATVLEPGDTLKDVLDRADRLMYRSKEEGRNRVTVG